jgi:pimeloyl-ACP methyl ester carboxylesterase
MLVTVEGAELHVSVDDFTDPWRRNDTVLMHNGFGRNGNFWRAWVPQLARELRVVRMDARSCGQSPPGPTAPSFHIDQFSADLVALLDELELERVHFIGESAGGIIGAWTAAHHPDRFQSLVLVSTPPQIVNHRNRPRAGDNAVKSAGLGSPLEALETLGMRGWWLRSRELGAELSGDQARDAYFADEFARTRLDVGMAFWHWLDTCGIDLRPLLSRLTMPVLVMSPGESHFANEEEQEQLVDALPNGRRIVYRTLTHEMYYVSPDVLARDAAEFFGEVARSGGE